MQPNTKLIRKWVDALRSGEYKQGRFDLAQCDEEDNLTHCCLGVACEMAGLKPNFGSSSPVGIRSGSYDGSLGLLPRSVANLLGLDLSPAVTGRSLTSLNDGGATFEEIADLIETRWLGGDNE